MHSGHTEGPTLLPRAGDALTNTNGSVRSSQGHQWWKKNLAQGVAEGTAAGGRQLRGHRRGSSEEKGCNVQIHAVQQSVDTFLENTPDGGVHSTHCHGRGSAPERSCHGVLWSPSVTAAGMDIEGGKGGEGGSQAGPPPKKKVPARSNA